MPHMLTYAGVPLPIQLVYHTALYLHHCQPVLALALWRQKARLMLWTFGRQFSENKLWGPLNAQLFFILDF
jgi:hypothetical protein